MILVAWDNLRGQNIVHKMKEHQNLSAEMSSVSQKSAKLNNLQDLPLLLEF